MIKRGKNPQKIRKLIETLSSGLLLPAQYLDHALKGNYSNHRECHIEPDWLLIYRIENGKLVLVRTGSHSDLFKSK
ncbi:MAG: type II toxin-antitoxin system YafQ family toxin [Saprospiraceae bacterium]|nr:type II toxin-antitoxin system YafQ family toxin [Saprospiraceae bacterium]